MPDGDPTVRERIERYSLDLGVELPRFELADVRALAYMKGLRAALELRFEDTGEAAVADLSPQLEGLEGSQVSVQDEPGDDWRTFTVGKTAEAIPHHTEVENDRHARLEYHRVRPLGRWPS